MAQFFKAQKQASRKHQLPKLEISVDTIDHQGKGICLSHKPIVVVSNAVPGELYSVQVTEKKQRVWFAKILKVLESSEHRIDPFCKHFSECGGCSQQAFSADYQFQYKQNALELFLRKNLEQRLFPSTLSFESSRFQKLEQDSAHPDRKQIEVKAYRRKARLSVDARNTDKVKIGYRAKYSNKVIDIVTCPILDKPVQAPLFALIKILKTHPLNKILGHITVLSDGARKQACLHLTKLASLHTLKSLHQETQALDLELVIEFKEQNALKKYSGLASLINSMESGGSLQTMQATFSISDEEQTIIDLAPNHFIQVNAEVNKEMLATAKQWLMLNKQDTLIDLYAGLGNFSLHFAKLVKQCVAVEGVAEMVELGRQNAKKNDLDNVSFKQIDLNETNALSSLSIPERSIFIVDPARQGALALMQVLSKLKPTRILYISCNPISFVKDANALSSDYKITKIKALDMFPYTEHIEMMLLLERVEG